MEYISLSDIASYKQGKQVPVEEQSLYCENGMKRFVRIVDFTNPGEPPRYICDLGSQYEVDEKSIVMIRYGSQTAGSIVRGIPGIIANNMFQVCINDERFDIDFMYYYLAAPTIKSMLMGGQSSSTMPAITFGMMRQIQVPIRTIEEQRKIAHILSIIDEKIETNKQINRNLEEQARAVFTSWFVRFECFDEPMKESPIGFEIPESLDLVQIGDLNPVLETGRRPKGGAVSEGIPSIGAESVKGLGNVNLSSNKYIPIEFAAKQKTGKVNGYELMIYKDGGKPGEFHPHFSMFGEGYPFADFYINEHVFKLDFGNRGFNELAYFYFQTDYC